MGRGRCPRLYLIRAAKFADLSKQARLGSAQTRQERSRPWTRLDLGKPSRGLPLAGSPPSSMGAEPRPCVLMRQSIQPLVLRDLGVVEAAPAPPVHVRVRSDRSSAARGQDRGEPLGCRVEQDVPDPPGRRGCLSARRTAAGCGATRPVPRLSHARQASDRSSPVHPLADDDIPGRSRERNHRLLRTRRTDQRVPVPGRATATRSPSRPCRGTRSGAAAGWRAARRHTGCETGWGSVPCCAGMFRKPRSSGADQPRCPLEPRQSDAARRRAACCRPQARGRRPRPTPSPFRTPRSS